MTFQTEKSAYGAKRGSAYYLTEMIKIISNGTIKNVTAEEGDSLLKVLQKNGYEISANCGGFGKCGKCVVKITYNGITETVKACSFIVKNGMTVELSYSSSADKADVLPPLKTDGKNGVGLALDIGTTTLAFYFVSLKTGKPIEILSALNPQRTFGADVISRISYADENGVEEMNKCLKTKVNEVIQDFLRRTSTDKISVMTVTGNTIMLHVFAGEQISSFGRYPFKPVFLNKTEHTGIALGYDAEKVICLPSFESFVGADIVCDAVATGIARENAILADLGTNGEILMSCNGKLYVTSVAAGPAFEGADIECGMGGISGAIRSVKKTNGGIEIETVGNSAPKGICGAGLIDAAAYMYSEGVIDETGAFLREKGRFYLTDEIYVSAMDVRKFQLAKSAVRSGIDVMLGIAERENTEINALYICGGLGIHINEDSAFRVGLIPKSLKGKVIASGNTAGIGAVACMLSEDVMREAERTAEKKTSVDLASDVDFINLFAENMTFENE